MLRLNRENTHSQPLQPDRTVKGTIAVAGGSPLIDDGDLCAGYRLYKNCFSPAGEKDLVCK